MALRAPSSKCASFLHEIASEDLERHREPHVTSCMSRLTPSP